MKLSANRDIEAALRRSESVPQDRRRLPPLRALYVLIRPGVQAVLLYRLARRLVDRRVPFLPQMVSAFSYFLTGAEIAPGARIGEQFVVYHPAGVVIHPHTTAGARLRIYSGVVIGRRPGSGRAGAPQLGDRVTIGAGAKILGPVQLGDGAMIGANAVVVKNVPSFHRAVGVPAEVAPLVAPAARE